jgi:hypothetical protein
MDSDTTGCMYKAAMPNVALVSGNRGEGGCHTEYHSYLLATEWHIVLQPSIQSVTRRDCISNSEERDAVDSIIVLCPSALSTPFYDESHFTQFISCFQTGVNCSPLFMYSITRHRCPLFMYGITSHCCPLFMSSITRHRSYCLCIISLDTIACCLCRVELQTIVSLRRVCTYHFTPLLIVQVELPAVMKSITLHHCLLFLYIITSLS